MRRTTWPLMDSRDPALPEVEETLIGAVLMHPATYAEIGDVVKAGDFYHPGRAAIYEAIQGLDEKQRPINAVTVAEELKNRETTERLNQLGGEGYLVEVQNRVVTLEGLRYLAQAVARKSYRRRCGQVLTELRGACYGVDDDEVYLARMERELVELMDSQERGEVGPRPIKPALKETITEIQRKYEARQRGENVDMPGVTGGLTNLDEILGGYQPGKFYVIAARPSHGKTAKVLTSTLAMAKEGTAVLGFSLEMDDRELILRMLASSSRVDGEKLAFARDLHTRDWINVSKGAAQLSEMPVWIDARGGLTWDAIRSRARRWRTKYTRNPDGTLRKACIWIDYLQLIDGAQDDGRRQAENRQQEIARVSRGCKELAKELNCPVIALSQLNRNLEARDDKRPRMSDLRESGAIEQDADVIELLYRDEVYHSCGKEDCGRCNENRGLAEVNVAKHRGGRTGMVRLAWLGPYTRFESLAEGRAEEAPPPPRRRPPPPNERTPGEDDE